VTVDTEIETEQGDNAVIGLMSVVIKL